MAPHLDPDYSLPATYLTALIQTATPAQRARLVRTHAAALYALYLVLEPLMHSVQMHVQFVPSPDGDA